MRVDSARRTVILQCYPTAEQEKELKKAEKSSLRFIEFSRREFQRLLYNKFKEVERDIDPRMLEKLAQRFTGSMGNKAILDFDKDNSKFVKENGAWFVEVKLFRGRNSRVRIPLAKTERKYYDVIGNLSKFPFVITRENDKWFVYVSVPVSEKVNGNIIGVDFNLRKWVASPYQGQPLFFDVTFYSKKVDEIRRRISRWQTALSKAKKIGDKDKIEQCKRMIKKLYKIRGEIVKLAHGEFLKRIHEKYGICTIGIEDVKTMYRLIEKDSKMINNWLYSKTAIRKFVLRAMAKGFNVVEVDPRDTTKKCHKCFSELKIKGKRGRIVECPNKCFKSYNRDLNAARNIALKAKKTR